MKILKKYNDVKTYIKRVSDEADHNKHCFGFLVESVYEQLAKKDSLWVLLDDSNNYIGHILFSIAWNKYKITVNQTYILEAYRKSHFASMLINELKEWAVELHANVAADLEIANSFYNKMGFIAVSRKKGGETTGRLINVRIATLNTPTLLNLSTHRVNEFSYNQPINLYRKYVVDINILLDFIIKREHTEQAQELIKGSLSGVYKLAVTPEAHVEIERNTKSLDPLAMLVANIPSLPMLEDIEETQEYQALKQLVFQKIDLTTKASIHKISDLKHLAYCILNKCTGFITGDQHLLKKASSLYAEFGIEIISPEEFIINEEDNPNNDTIISLDDLSYKFVTVSEDSYSLNECLSDLEVLRETIQLPAFEGIVVEQEAKNYLACALWSKTVIGNRDAVAYIFSKNLVNNELFDHIIETIFRMIKSKKVSSIAIFTQGLISHIDKVLKVRGFSPITESNGMIKYSHLILDEIITENNWDKQRQVVNDKLKLELPNTLADYKELTTNGILLKNREYFDFFEFETKFSPSLIIPKNRTIYIIPIRSEYAKELIGDDFDAQRSFCLSNQKPALLKTEKAYFSKPGKGIIPKGSLIMFYVSKPIKSVIGIARVTYSDTIQVDKAIDILTLQGVLEKDKMLKNSKDGKIDVFTFDNFHQYPKNVGINLLTSLNVGKNNFITKFKITRDKFLKICEYGGIYGN